MVLKYTKIINLIYNKKSKNESDTEIPFFNCPFGKTSKL